MLFSIKSATKYLKLSSYKLYSHINYNITKSLQLKQMSNSHIYNPKVICHRGYCSIFPQNTMQSIEVALTRCDYIQFDILLTKDQQVIVFHDRHLSTITNIQTMERFKDRKNKYYDNQSQLKEESKIVEDWWVKQHTLEELRMLEVKQRFKNRPQLSMHAFKISTLEQTFQYILSLKQQIKDNNCGFLIQIKPLKEYQNSQQDVIIVQKLIKILQKFNLTSQQKCASLNFPIILQSFNFSIVKRLNQSKIINLPLIALIDKHIIVDQQFKRQYMRGNIKGIGISIKHAKKQIVDMFVKEGKEVFFWTVRDDMTDKLPKGMINYREAYQFLFKLGITGVITQFPQNCYKYLETYQNKLDQKARQ